LQLTEGTDADANPSSRDTIERQFSATANLGHITGESRSTAFTFPPQLTGAVTLTAREVLPGLCQLTVTVENLTAGVTGQDLDRALDRALLSTHTLLRVTDGNFVSLLDPPESYRAAAASCRNVGAWPVLIGPEPGRMMLAAPIVLYDYPQVAPESPGDLFDATEIDELLSLRIQTLTAAEKREMSATSEQARAVLERTDSLTENQLLQLHGRLRRRNSPETACDFQPGDRVRLWPRRTADALDLLLSGQTATVVSVQRDFEDAVHLSVVIDDDPGRDFGQQGLPGHRFFYRPEEVERL
jgi:hydrogenase maturation protease